MISKANKQTESTISISTAFNHLSNTSRKCYWPSHCAMWSVSEMSCLVTRILCRQREPLINREEWWTSECWVKMFFLTPEVRHVLEVLWKASQIIRMSLSVMVERNMNMQNSPLKGNCLQSYFWLLISFVDLENFGTDYISPDLKHTMH